MFPHSKLVCKIIVKCVSHNSKKSGLRVTGDTFVALKTQICMSSGITLVSQARQLVRYAVLYRKSS